MPSVNELYNEAEKLKDSGQPEQAIEKLQELLTQAPEHVLTHMALGVLYGKVGKHELAVQHAEQACRLDPTDAFHFTALSITYQRAFAGTGNQSYIRMAGDARDRAHGIQGRAPGHRE